MATRFYYDNANVWDASATPTGDQVLTGKPDFRSEWHQTSPALRAVRLGLSKAESDKTCTQATKDSSSNDPYYALIRQYVSAPLAAQTLSGSLIQGQLFAGFETAATDKVMRAIHVRAVQQDGTDYGTPKVIYSSFPTGLSNEFIDYGSSGGKAENRYFPLADTYTGVTIAAGDRIVVEIGAAWIGESGNGATFIAEVVFGDDGTSDLPVDESTQTSLDISNGSGDANDPAASDPDGWLQFGETIETALNAWTMHASGGVGDRLLNPDIVGMGFFATDELSWGLWDGTNWHESDATGSKLWVPGSTANTLTLSDSGSEGAVLTAADTFAANILSLHAPNDTFPFQVGKWGNISMAGTFPSDDVLLNFQYLLFNTANSLYGINASLKNTGTGAVTGININAQHGGSSANGVKGQAITAILTGAGSTGQNTGLEIINQNIGTASRGTIRGLWINPLSFFGNTVTDVAWIDVENPLSSGTFANQWGLRCAPGAGFTAGTNRWTVQGFNKIECTGSDLIASTAGKGLIGADVQGTPRFWRTYIDVTGTTVDGFTVSVDSNRIATFTRAGTPTGAVNLNVDDVGTSAPAT